MQRYFIFTNNHRVAIGKNATAANLLATEKEYEIRNSDDYQKLIDHLFDENRVAENFVLVKENASNEEILTEFRSFFRVDIAAGGVICNPEKQWLFIFRRNKWDLPKGHCEKGETLQQTALREVEEECGLQNLEIIKPLPTTFHLYRENHQAVFKQTHWFLMKTNGNFDHATPQREEDITAVKWFAWNDLNVVLKNTYPNILHLLQEVNGSDFSTEHKVVFCPSVSRSG